VTRPWVGSFDGLIPAGATGFSLPRSVHTGSGGFSRVVPRLFTGDQASGPNVGHSPTFTADVKNEWHCTFLVWTVTTLLFIVSGGKKTKNDNLYVIWLVSVAIGIYGKNTACCG
jgi:hypothetical protein